MSLFGWVGDVVDDTIDAVEGVVDYATDTIQGAMDGDMAAIATIALATAGGWALFAGAGTAAAGATTVSTTATTTASTTAATTAAGTSSAAASTAATATTAAQGAASTAAASGATTAQAAAATAKELTLKEALMAGAKTIGKQALVGAATNSAMGLLAGEPEGPKLPQERSRTEVYDTTPTFKIGTRTPTDTNQGNVSGQSTKLSSVSVLRRTSQNRRNGGF